MSAAFRLAPPFDSLRSLKALSEVEGLAQGPEQRRRALRVGFLLAAAAFCGAPAGFGAEGAPPARDSVLSDVTQGALRFKGTEGKYVECPLKHTDVQAEIAGFIARVKVTQEFHNPSGERIEAVYVFPLPHESAVDGMTMKVGERTAVGIIKKRAEARRIYRKALAQGQTAALLEQERPNIFVQSVGNIQPGQTVKIEISYADVLSYDLGAYSFHFPMVVGPRYSPAGSKDGIGAVPAGAAGAAGASGRKTEVQYLKPGERNGHDISLSLTLDAGVPVHDLKSVNHKVQMKQTGKHSATCAILPSDAIPNKDFELKYRVAGAKPEVAVLAHATSAGDGYFLLMVQPREDDSLRRVTPRELVFLVDVSGSMGGAPTEKVKQVMQGFLERSVPGDKIQVLTFANQVNKLFPQPVECTGDNIAKALAFSRKAQSLGGTEMLKGVQSALAEPADAQRMRIVIMLTDGFIDNEDEILQEVAKRCNDKVRFWCIGVGSSVNRHLVDAVAKQGGGMGKVLGLNSTAGEVGALVAEVTARTHRPQVAGLAVNWGALKVSEVYPERIPELWSGRPVVLFGRYAGGGKGRIQISGDSEGRAVSFDVPVELPEKEAGNAVLAPTWARRKIASITERDGYYASPAAVEEITQLALEYRIMTRYTSFVAVDQEAPKAGPEPSQAPRKLAVPVPVPEGTDPKGVFGPSGKDEVIITTEIAKSKPPEYDEPKMRMFFKKTDEVPADAAVDTPLVVHEGSDRFETDSARGIEDAISDIPLGGTGTVGSVGVGGGGMVGSFGYRDGGGRKKATARWGGSAATESAFEASLLWLARHQEKDGSWDPKKLGATADCRGEATGLALLAFLGAGYTQASGKFADNVKRAGEWVVARQTAGRRGGFDTSDTGYWRTHAVLALALSEAGGMTKDDQLGKSAQAAVDTALAIQGKDGGWSAGPDQAADMVTTAWFLAALKSARIAGLKVDGSGLAKASAFLDKAVAAKPGVGFLMRPGDGAPDPAATMAAVSARLLLGTPNSDEALVRAARWAVAEGRKAGLDQKRDPVWLYFGTLGCFQLGGDDWKDWNEAMKGVLLPRQEKGGPMDGSDKDLDGSWPADGAPGGRVMTTVLAQLCLEVYYRYLPVYSR